MDVLEKIKKLQQAHGYSNKQLAKASGLSPSTLQGLYNRNNLPTLPTLTAICTGLGITLAQLIAETNVPPDLTPEQINLLEIFGTLTDEQKRTLIAFLNSI